MFLFASSTVDNLTSSAVDSLNSSAEDLKATAEQSIDYLGKIWEALASHAQSWIGTLIIFIIGWYVCKFIRKLVKNSLDRSRLDASVSSFINSLTKFALYILLAVLVITRLGVDTTSIVALLTSASLAVGLALQGSLSNFAGGVLLLIMKPFTVGDYINDGSGHEGKVTAIEIIYTRLLTSDNKSVFIPNGTLANSPITNYTRQDSRRVDIEVGIDYGENIDKVRKVLLDIANNSGYSYANTEPQVFVASFDSSSVAVTLRMWCETDNYWPAKFAIQESIKKEFDKQDINIPYDHMDVNIISSANK